jgi:uncharacterized membrane protein YdfJ with MMPL/SSD domain
MRPSVYPSSSALASRRSALIDGVVIRTVLVPAIMQLLGEWGLVAGKRLPRIAVEPPRIEPLPEAE